MLGARRVPIAWRSRFRALRRLYSRYYDENTPEARGLRLLRAWFSHYRYPIMSVTLDGALRQTPTLALSIAIGRREGNFVLAPDALVDSEGVQHLPRLGIP